METTIEFEEETLPVYVLYNYYPGDPGVHSYSNGDPGYPPTGPEVEITSIVDHLCREHIDTLDSKQMERIEQEILNLEPEEPDFDI